MITLVLCCNTPLIQYIGELNVFACSRCEEKYCSQFSLIIVSRDLERTGGGELVWSEGLQIYIS